MHLTASYHCNGRRVVAADDRDLLFRVRSYVKIDLWVRRSVMEREHEPGKLSHLKPRGEVDTRA